MGGGHGLSKSRSKTYTKDEYCGLQAPYIRRSGFLRFLEFKAQFVADCKETRVEGQSSASIQPADAGKGAMATILVVDDEPLVRTTLKWVLGRAGHEIVFCESGEEALAAFSERTFDAVLSDVRMPQGDGAWLLREVRNMAPEIPVFLMTGLTDDRRLDGVVFDSRTKLLKKPLDLRSLIALLAPIGKPTAD